MNQIKDVYKVLLSEYGPQGWWPLTPRGKIESEHHQGKPSGDSDRFEILVGAILTQNTAWTGVEKALLRLSEEGLVDHKKLRLETHAKVAGLIKSAGYFNQKAARLLMISEFVNMHGMKSLLGKDKDILREILLSLNGVGPETADSMLLYAFEKPSFVIDAYTKRIFSRMGLCDPDTGYDKLKRLFENSLKGKRDKVKVFNEYHALIVEHAKRSCKAKPECGGCVLSSNCKKIISR